MPFVKRRRAGRVVVLDPDDRVLLFRYDDPPPNGRHWATPGGGLNDGESYEVAAQRELTEETGWTDVPIGDEVQASERTIAWRGKLALRQHERFYLARVAVARREVADVAGMHASDGIAAWRWWTLAEMDSTAETIWPAGLADVIRDALS